MPRDSNGNYTLPAGNPVVTGEVISTGWANPTMSDIGSELTNSLDRQGRGGMLAPFKFVDGTNSQPGITWTNEPTTGFYRAGGADMRATVAGVARMRWTGSGVDVYDAIAGTWVALSNASGINFAVLNQVNIFTQSQTFGGTYAPSATIDSQAGSFGVGLKVRGRVTDNVGMIAFNSSDGAEDYAYIGSLVPDSFSVFTNAFTERFRIDGTGAATFIPNGTAIAEINASGISTYAGGQTRFYSADNSRFGMIYNSNGVLIFDTLQPMGTDAMKFQMGGVDWFTMTGSVANFYNGMPLRFYQADNTGYGEIKNSNGILSLNSPALGFDVNSVRYLDMSGGSINVYDGKAIRYYGPGNAGTLAISKPNSTYSSIDELGGLPIVFYLGGVEKFRIASNGPVLYNGNSLSLLNADNSTNAVLAAGNVQGQIIQGGAGASIYHLNAENSYGGVTVSTSAAPASGGTPGQIWMQIE